MQLLQWALVTPFYITSMGPPIVKKHEWESVNQYVIF